MLLPLCVPCIAIFPSACGYCWQCYCIKKMHILLHGPRSIIIVRNFVLHILVLIFLHFMATRKSGTRAVHGEPRLTSFSILASDIPSIMSVLHIGHVRFDRSHWSMQSMWKSCKHGSVRTDSPTSFSLRQIIHVTCSSSAGSIPSWHSGFMITSRVGNCPICTDVAAGVALDGKGVLGDTENNKPMTERFESCSQ